VPQPPGEPGRRGGQPAPAQSPSSSVEVSVLVNSIMMIASSTNAPIDMLVVAIT
jgi:hypothetical protein